MTEADDILATFCERAEEVALELQLRPGAVQEGAGILKNALGADFIARVGRPESVRTPSPVVMPFRHRLGECLAGGGLSQVVEALEVASYFKALARTPQLDDVVKVLRNDYAAGFLQLSYGYRFQRLGVEGLTFEPPTVRGGKSDIAFRLDGRQFLVECYVPRLPAPPSSYELHRSAQAIVSQAGDDGLEVCIRLRKTLEPAGRKAIKKLIASRGAETNLENEWATVQIAPFEEVRLGPDDDKHEVYGRLNQTADWVFLSSSIARADQEKLQRGEGVASRITGLLRAWGPPGEERPRSPEEIAEDLSQRVSRKLAQAKDTEGSARLLIMGFPGLMVRSDSSKQVVMQRVQNRIERLHERAAGVLFADRIWLHAKRYMSIGVYAPGVRVVAA